MLERQKSRPNIKLGPITKKIQLYAVNVLSYKIYQTEMYER